jgi:uncharacterized membrane protein
MKKNNNKTAMVMSIAVLTLVLMGTACSNNNNAEPSLTSSPSISASSSASTAPETESASPTASPEAQISTGEYEGQPDGHSIEIKTADGPTVYQISPEIGEKVSAWEPGTSVKYQFTEDTLDVDGKQVKQLTIITIDKQ